MHRSASLFMAALLLAGCTQPASRPATPTGSAAEVAQAFTAFKTAMKERNGDKLYELLDSDGRHDADREAKLIKEKFSKADDKENAALAKRLGLAAEKLQNLTGKGFLASDLFYNYDEHNELEEVKQPENVAVSGNSAKVEFKDPDDQSKMLNLALVREDGQWRFTKVKMPRGVE